MLVDYSIHIPTLKGENGSCPLSIAANDVKNHEGCWVFGLGYKVDTIWNL